MPLSVIQCRSEMFSQVVVRTHCLNNKFSKIVLTILIFKNRPLTFNNGDLKLRDLAKLWIFKLIMKKSNFKKITSQKFSILAHPSPPIKISGYTSVFSFVHGSDRSCCFMFFLRIRIDRICKIQFTFHNGSGIRIHFSITLSVIEVIGVRFFHSYSASVFQKLTPAPWL